MTLSAQIPQGVNYDGFVIRYGTDPNQMDQQTTVESLPATVTGLDNYTRYYFSVSILRDGEEGRRSQTVAAVPEDQAMSDVQRAYLDYQASISRT